MLDWGGGDLGVVEKGGGDLGAALGSSGCGGEVLVLLRCAFLDRRLIN